MRELNIHEVEAVSGGGMWQDAALAVGGASQIILGVGYTYTTGGVGEVLGGAALITGGAATINSAFNSAHENIKNEMNN